MKMIFEVEAVHCTVDMQRYHGVIATAEPDNAELDQLYIMTSGCF